MKVLGILLLIALALFLLTRLRLSLRVEYAQAGASVKLKLGPYWRTLYPPRPKKEKAARPAKKDKKQEASEPEPKEGGSFASVKRYLPLITDCAGRLRRKLRVDKLYLDFTAAASDPAAAALAFGGANVALGALWPLIEQSFDVRERRIRTAVDFNAKTPIIYLYAALTLNLGQALSISARLLGRFLKRSGQEKKKEAVSVKEPSS